MSRFFILILLFAGCYSPKKERPLSPPDVFMMSNDSLLRNLNGIWMTGGAAFSGYIIEKEGKTVTACLPVVNGKENGTAYGWYKSGHKRYERRFLNGNREGVQQGWHENDTVSFQYFFHDDKYEGAQRTFFENGRPWQTLNYRNGYEEGKQKSWNDTGRVVNNFTVKNGKLYGVIGRYDCMAVYKK